MSEVDVFCRTCMEKFPNKPEGNKGRYNIFEITNLASKLSQCSRLRAYPADEYPHSLCTKCYQMVLDFFEFQRMCRDSAIAFKEILSIGMQEKIDNSMSMDYSTGVDEASERESVESTTISPKDSETVRKCGEYDLDETFNDDQLIEFSINDAVFEDEYEIESLHKPKIDIPLPVKGIGERMKANDTVCTEQILKINNFGYKMKSQKKIGTTELINSKSLNNFNKLLENLSDCEEEDVNLPSADDKFLHSNSDVTVSDLPFQCNLCPKLFRVKDRLIAHKRRHEGLGGYPCTRDNCKRTYNRLIDLRQHISDHDVFPREIYKCDINGCGLEYTTKQAINMHLQKQHNFGSTTLSDSKYVCETCGVILKNGRSLQQHQLLHVDKSLWPFKCDVNSCFKRFRTVEHYKEHKNRHDGIKPYACPHCEKRFCSSSNLSVHVNYHTLEKKWLCPFCPRIAYTPANLRHHIQKQHENKPNTIPCRFCNKVLSSYTSRKYHEMIHTGEKPYVCEICGKGFTQPTTLKNHNRTHTGEDSNKKLNCLFCERSFSTAVDLKNHVLKHTGEKPHECEECGVKFRYQSNLRRHHRQKLCRKHKNIPKTN